MKSYGNWDTQDIRQTFGLIEVENLLTLSKWLSVSVVLSEKEKRMLELLSDRIIELEENWNEDELKMNFVSPLMLLADYGTINTYNAFFQRTLSATIQSVEINEIADMIIAGGWTKPIKPYFFLHKYTCVTQNQREQQVANKGNLRGQLLAAMLTAQTLNANDKPIFGVYLVGASWRFVVLEGKNYAVKRFDATEKEDLFQIFAMLKWIKVYIEKDLGLR